MRYPSDILDEIRTRLPVSAVVGRKVRLKKAGREWKGLSPFNAEKTPSFFVNDQKGFYHCFSSGKHGDIFTFLMETEGLSFPEAVERLAAEAGVALPTISREAERGRRSRRKSLHEVMELAAAFFEAQLQGRAGAAARDYLARPRPLRPRSSAASASATPRRSAIALRDHLAGEGRRGRGRWSSSASSSRARTSPCPYDRFRDRVMFPIADGRGRVVAFGGRAMSADVPAKYLNSPGHAALQQGPAALQPAPGPRGRPTSAARSSPSRAMSTSIAMTMAGFAERRRAARHGADRGPARAPVALRRRADPVLRRRQGRAPRRLPGDRPRAAEPHRRQVAALRAPARGAGPGRPPARRRPGGGRAGAERRPARSSTCSGRARPRPAPLDTPERRAALEQRLRQALAAIRDETLRRYYREEIEAPPGGAPRGRAAPLRRDGGGDRPATAADGRAPASATGRPACGAARRARFSPRARCSSADRRRRRARPSSSACLSAHPELLHDHAETLAELDLAGRDAEGGPRPSCSTARRAARRGDPADPRSASRPGRARARPRPSLPPGSARATAGRSIRHADPLRLADALRQAITLHRRARTLHSELRAAERALAEEESEANLAWLREVQNQLSSVEGAEADAEEIAGRAGRRRRLSCGSRTRGASIRPARLC